MEGGIKALGGGLVEAFEEVPVCIEGGSDGRVSKTLLDHFRVLTLADQQGDVGVSQVMESERFSHGGTDGRQPETLADDLATVVNVDQERKSLTVRLDRDPETRDLPVWYLDQGHVDYGYALTGHKAQGVTTDHTFVIVDGTTNREWAYVAMSRGRQTNTLYLTNPQPPDEQCTHLTHQGQPDALDRLTAALNHGSAQTAAIDHAGPAPTDDIDPFGPPPPSSDIAARIAWQIAKRQTQRDSTQRQNPGLDLAVGR